MSQRNGRAPGVGLPQCKGCKWWDGANSQIVQIGVPRVAMCLGNIGQPILAQQPPGPDGVPRFQQLAMIRLQTPENWSCASHQPRLALLDAVSEPIHSTNPKEVA